MNALQKNIIDNILKDDSPCLMVRDYIYPACPPVEAGTWLADLWSGFQSRSMVIDLWGCDFFGEEFFHSFLDRCNKNGWLNDALSINWKFPCETANQGDPFRIQANTWALEFILEIEDK